MRARRLQIVAGLIALITVGLSLAIVGYLWSGFADQPIDSMTLYSLDGMYDLSHGPSKGETFHDYPVLGKVDVPSPKDRLAILAAVKKGIAEFDGYELKCFLPRHGVRLAQNGKTIDYLICFHCSELAEYMDGQHSFHGTSDRAADVLNEHLDAAGVPRQTSVPFSGH